MGIYKKRNASVIACYELSNNKGKYMNLVAKIITNIIAYLAISILGFLVIYSLMYSII